MNETQLNRGIELHSEIKDLKYILEAMNQQPDICIHLHKNLGEDISIKNKALVYEILKLIRDQKERSEKVFKAL